MAKFTAKSRRALTKTKRVTFKVAVNASGQTGKAKAVIKK